MLLAASKKDRRQFEAKLGDFGMARVLDGSRACHLEGCPTQGTHIHTRTHGTSTHMPPELLSSHGGCPPSRLR